MLQRDQIQFLVRSHLLEERVVDQVVNVALRYPLVVLVAVVEQIKIMQGLLVTHHQ
tara:strand:- start:155 stop:322 length:168 start_codon:yes stop_codon:yes gene_type:complete